MNTIIIYVFFFSTLSLGRILQGKRKARLSSQKQQLLFFFLLPDLSYSRAPLVGCVRLRLDGTGQRLPDILCAVEVAARV